MSDRRTKSLSRFVSYPRIAFVLTCSSWCLLTVSDTAYIDPSADKSGPILCSELARRSEGFVEVVHHVKVPDEAVQITATAEDFCKDPAICLVLTTGGTGFSPRDVTPEVS